MPITTAFQKNAFQNNAFQIGAANVGWMPEWRFRHDPARLEERLREQKESRFSLKWYDRFLEAEEAARQRIGEVKDGEQRAALEGAVEQSVARASEALDAGYIPKIDLSATLRAAAGARDAAALLKYAGLAQYAARFAPKPPPRPAPPEKPDGYAALGFTKADLRRFEQEARDKVKKAKPFREDQLPDLGGFDLSQLEENALAAIRPYLK